MRTVKISMILSIIFSCNSAFAGINAAKGFYLGVDVYHPNMTTLAGSSFSLNKDKAGVSFWRMRARAGYRFNDFFAAETEFNNILRNSHRAQALANPPLGPDHYRLYSVDLAGKAIYPFANSLSVFAKAGFSYVHQNIFNQVFLHQSPPNINNHQHRFSPSIGCGANFNFTQRVAAELSYTSTLGSGSIKAVNMLALGGSYTFGK
jgi:opacity protein-like surface antigen